MSILSKKMVVGMTAVAISLASAGAFAQDRYDQDRYGNPSRNDGRYDQRHDDGGYDSRYDDREGGYDYAKVVDVEPLRRSVRVTTPVRECWDETRYDDRGYAMVRAPMRVAPCWVP